MKVFIHGRKGPRWCHGRLDGYEHGERKNSDRVLTVRARDRAARRHHGSVIGDTVVLNCLGTVLAIDDGTPEPTQPKVVSCGPPSTRCRVIHNRPDYEFIPAELPPRSRRDRGEEGTILSRPRRGDWRFGRDNRPVRL